MPVHPLWNPFNPDNIPGKKTVHFSDGELVTNINLSLAIGRPLLLTGKPGSGKSSVARGVADALEWAPLEMTVTSRLDATELKAAFDTVGRLNDASDPTAPRADKAHYLHPGILWHAYDPEGAARFRSLNQQTVSDELRRAGAATGRVLLIDEIDKGDLDFANDLLDVFDDGNFEIPVLGGTVERRADRNLLVVITSNGERDLSGAFLRRCIPHSMQLPQFDHAVSIGRAHLVFRGAAGELLSDERLHVLAECAVSPEGIDVAEYVDLIDAVLQFRPAEADWKGFVEAIVEFARRRREATRRLSGSA